MQSDDSLEAELRKEGINKTQKQINDLSKDEYKLWAQKYMAIFQKHFPQSCVCVPKQKTQSEMRKENEETLRYIVDGMLEETLREVQSENFEDFLKVFKRKVCEECPDT